MNKIEYQKYLASREWAMRKQAIKKRARNICERCGLREIRATHHLTYENVGNEPLTDLLGVCEQCHEYLSGVSDSDPRAGLLVVVHPVLDKFVQIIKSVYELQNLLDEKIPGFAITVQGNTNAINEMVSVMAGKLMTFCDPELMQLGAEIWNTCASETSKNTSTTDTDGHHG